MTPAEWAELDRLQREQSAAYDAWFDGGLDPASPEWETALARSAQLEEHLKLCLFATARALIDAARPKCARCSGTGYRDPTEGGSRWEHCPDCDGTGWAK